MKAIATAILVFFGLSLLGCASHNVAPPPPSSEGADMSRSRQKAFDEAADALHRQIHAPKADVAAVSQVDVTWEDSCLGCAKTAESCKHVMTPGYRIFLRVRDATYEYHTDRSGHDVRLCGQAGTTQ
jgi:hypothetical protein